MINNDGCVSNSYSSLENPDLREPSINKFETLVTIILPAFNEALALPIVLEELSQVIDNRYQIIVVDDGSTDETAIVARQYACVLVQHPTNYGKGVAVRTGIRHARGNKVIIMDADATYPASAIPKLVNLLNTYDLVRCIRLEGLDCMPITNRVGNWIFNRLLVNLLGMEGADQFSGLYGIRRERLVQMDLEAEKFDLEAEINMKAKAFGLSVATFPIVYQIRLGDKKLHPLRDGCHILIRILFLNMVHNSILMFVLPGIGVAGLGILVVTIFHYLKTMIPNFHMNISSLSLASVCLMFGVHLITIGLAAAFYSFKPGLRIRPWLIWISSVHVRFSVILLGAAMSSWGVAQLISCVNALMASNTASILHSQTLVLGATLMIGGLQVVSTTLFVSIFVSHFRKIVIAQSTTSFNDT